MKDIRIICNVLEQNFLFWQNFFQRKFSALLYEIFVMGKISLERNFVRKKFSSENFFCWKNKLLDKKILSEKISLKKQQFCYHYWEALSVMAFM